ncbi:universal stress protein [Arthrobacter sp. Bz4]|uniref:universal stress protein n=1 Tax=Arthrobacter sp. Bz4 TaxID=2171979 RepID=UPI000D522756|nr:universal stress protein [Arthrobacter sp. Bz4]PVE16948.1 universal stress protein [Arthrobacter sp. Bz4]
MSTHEAPQHPILVGYDGSDTSERAVLWAAHHAAATGLPLVVVHCWMGMSHSGGPGSIIDASDSARRAAERTAARGLELAKQAEPDVNTSAHLIVGHPSEVLTKASTDASLLVTGSRGLGGFKGLLIGSVSLHLASCASCPVAVVRKERLAKRGILVAIDGSPQSDKALLFAADMAKARHTSLRLLHIRPYSRYAITRPPVSESKNDPVVQQALDLLDDDVDVTIVEDSLDGPTVPRNIVLHAQKASCVVVGAKGRNTLTVRLGSTVHAVLHYAQGTTIIVR